ncbi:hypothetical protein PIB30_025796 [Stylosanthes scabra]|uniref:SHSP domain-containing protein n=1 Tax=Stylosanthes scabra TaxID=79078 RepID=A0ABU6TAV3_9FABA|nr:hypothetical protein [Stylosanthes scabra]
MIKISADLVEYPNRYVFMVDMPGMKASEINLRVEDENIMVVTGERKREQRQQDDGVKYLRTERMVGKFLRIFSIPDNGNKDRISALCKDGVLSVTIEKLPPREWKEGKTIEVKSA